MPAPDESPGGQQPRGVWRSLARSFRHRDFRLFFGGQFVSLVGTWMQQMAQSWLVYRITGSSLSLGMVGFASQFPVFVLALFGGVLADRLSRRAVLVGTQTASLVQAAILAALTFTGHVQLWQVMLLATFLGVVNAVDIPTRQSFVVEMVGKDDLHNAIALNSSLVNLARILGPSVAGVLLAAVGEAWCFTLNALSFLAVIVSLLLMSAPTRPPADKPASLRTHLAEGLGYAWRTREVRVVLLMLGATSLLGMSCMVLMPVFAGEILHGGPRALGLLMACFGCGSLAGALRLAARSVGRGIGRFAYYGMLCFGACLALFGQSTLLWLSALLLVPVGYFMIVAMAACNTIVQMLCPDELRGRVMALYSMMFMGMTPFGALLSGALAHWTSAGTTVTMTGAACVLVLLAGGRRLLAL